MQANYKNIKNFEMPDQKRLLWKQIAWVLCLFLVMAAMVSDVEFADTDDEKEPECADDMLSIVTT